MTYAIYKYILSPSKIWFPLDEASAAQDINPAEEDPDEPVVPDDPDEPVNPDDPENEGGGV